MNKECPTPAADTANTLPPVKCAPWCEDGHGHVNAYSPEDQYCSAGYVEMELERDPEQVSEDGPFYPRQFVSSLERDPFSEPFVSVSCQGRLTIDEAERAAQALLAAVKLARG